MKARVRSLSVPTLAGFTPGSRAPAKPPLWHRQLPAQSAAQERRHSHSPTWLSLLAATPPPTAAALPAGMQQAGLADPLGRFSIEHELRPFAGVALNDGRACSEDIKAGFSLAPDREDDDECNDDCRIFAFDEEFKGGAGIQFRSMEQIPDLQDVFFSIHELEFNDYSYLDSVQED